MNSEHVIDVGPAGDFPLETLRIITVSVPRTGSTREIGIVRRSDGTVDAVRNWCPHKGAPICKGSLTGTMLPGAPGTLTWGRDGEILRCPWHGFEFEMKTGGRPYSDSRMRLRVYPANIIDGQIHLDLGPRRSTEDAS